MTGRCPRVAGVVGARFALGVVAAVAAMSMFVGCGPSPSSTSQSKTTSESGSTGGASVPHEAEAEQGAGSAAGAGSEAIDRPQVMATTYPMEYFARRIAGGLVRVESPLPEGEDPIFWQPSREVLQRYQQAEVIVVNGADFERWVASAALPLSRICDASRGFASEFVRFETTKHRHGSGGMHSHEGIDGHTWMDPNNAVRQVASIEEALTRRWPLHAKQFRENAGVLKGELMGLDARLREISPRLSGMALIASHPAYNYLAKRYGWSITNIDLPPDLAAGDALSPAQTRKLDGAFGAFGAIGASGALGGARTSGAGTEAANSGQVDRTAIVLFEQAPNEIAMQVLNARAAAARVRALPVVFSPVETRPEPQTDGSDGSSRDFLTVMRANIGALDAVIEAAGRGPAGRGTESVVPSAGGG